MPGASNDGGEDSPGSVITGESGLAHSGAIVHDKSGNILVTHDEGGLLSSVGESNKDETWSKFDLGLKSKLETQVLISIFSSLARLAARE